MLRRLLTLLIIVATLAACTAAAPRDRGTDGPAGRNPAAPTLDPSPEAGAARPPARPAGKAPGRRFPVGERALALNNGATRPLPVTVWYPARAEGSTAVASGRFPVVLFSHGLGGDPDDYRRLLQRWASAGFVVAAPAYPFTSRGVDQLNVLDVLNQPADASRVLDGVLALDSRAGDRLRGHLDRTRVAAAGHSAGAITTVGLFTARRDPRLTAGIVLAGSSLGVGTGFGGTPAPLLFVHGQRDEVVSYASGKALYDAVPWPKALLTLRSGGHAVAPGGQGFDVVEQGTTNFLRWSLYGDPAAKRRLDSADGGSARLENRL